MNTIIKRIRPLVMSLLAIYLASVSVANAQQTFQRVYSDSNSTWPQSYSYGLSIFQTADGGFVTAGISTNPSGPAIARISPSGELVWAYRQNASFTSITELVNHNLIAVGSQDSSTRILILTVGGQVIFDSLLRNHGNPEIGVSLVADADSTIVVSGQDDSVIVRKFDNLGRQIWIVPISGKMIDLNSSGHHGNVFAVPHRAIVKRTHDVIVASDSAIFSLSFSGIVNWKHVLLPGTLGIRATNSDANFQVFRWNGQKINIMLFDSSGEYLMRSGACELAGGPDGQNNSAAAVSLSEDSQVVWKRNYASPPSPSEIGGRWNRGVDIIPTSDGGFAMTGLYGGTFSQSPSPRASSLYVIKLDSLGNTSELEIRTMAELGVSNRFNNIRSVVFPQPATYAATIPLDPSDDRDGEAVLTTLSGKSEIYRFGAGAKSVVITRGDLPAGVYPFVIRRESLPSSKGKIVFE